PTPQPNPTPTPQPQPNPTPTPTPNPTPTPSPNPTPTPTPTPTPNPAQPCTLPADSIGATAVATVSTNTPYTVSWNAVAGASAYDVEESIASDFTGAATTRATGTSAAFQHAVSVATIYYYRVSPVNSCGIGAPSGTVRVVVIPQIQTRGGNGNDETVVAPFGTRTPIVRTLTITLGNIAGKSAMETGFNAGTSEPWLTVDPPSGTIPVDGNLSLNVTVDPSTLPPGTSTAALNLTTSGGASLVSKPVSVSLVTPVSPVKNTPVATDNVLIVPAVAHTDGQNSKWQSDIRLSHTYNFPTQFELIFRGSAGQALKTTLMVHAHETIALDDIVGTWFGGGVAEAGSTGFLEVHTVSPIGDGRALASSRLFNATANGSYGQFIAAIPLSRFLSAGGAMDLLSLAQSSEYRTNFGIVEAAGQNATAALTAFDAAGTKLFEDMLTLMPGQHQQLGAIFAAHGVSSDNARVEVRLASPTGRVFAYASVVDNETGDPSFIEGAAADAKATELTIPGVAALQTATGRWQSDLRLYNAGAAPTTTTLALYQQGSNAAPVTRQVTVQPGETRAIDDVLSSLFDLSTGSGMLRITGGSSSLVAAARTYHARADGTYGQMIAAQSKDQAIGAGDSSREILQVEESSRFRTNIGFAEVTGNPATVELTVDLPDSKVAATTSLELGANEFLQLNQVLRSMGLEDAFNARVSVQVTGGAGKVLAYASVVDNRTLDPTYVPAQ
ncbi:MAG TPA: hypothetical protein VGR02_23110, partial [Thermoanaerobaculia bacterium]|nr:hypothetical protein [Thermoanaerobaculia bacterium]